MSEAQVHRRLRWNTASNYARTIARLFTGLLTFRLLYQELDGELFGIWALLWSIFGYGALLDLGFGVTVLKRTAEHSAQSEWEPLSRLISSVLAYYAGCAVLVIVLGLASTGLLAALFQVSSANIAVFETTLRVFFIGMGLALPTCVFSEILKGRQQIFAANATATVFALVNLGAVILGGRLGWELPVLLAASMACVILPNLLNGWLALRSLPQVRVSFRHASLSTLLSASGFSLRAFVGTMSTLVRGRTDQVTISLFLGVAWVPLYQAGAKLGEMFGLFANQLGDALMPAAAHLNGGEDRGAVRRLALQGMRLTALVGMPVYLAMAFQMQTLLELLTGEESVSPAALVSGQLAVLWFFLIAVTQSVFQSIFFMCGRERELSNMAAGEAAMNIALSVVLISLFGSVSSVIAASLAATLYFALRHRLPLASLELGVSQMELARQLIGRPALLTLPMVGWFLLSDRLLAVLQAGPWFGLVVNAMAAAILTAISLWFGALTAAERARGIALVNRILKTWKPFSTQSAS